MKGEIKGVLGSRINVSKFLYRVRENLVFWGEVVCMVRVFVRRVDGIVEVG